MKVNFGENREFYLDYLFRITDGDSPFQLGSWSKDNPKENASNEIYVSPVIYSWASHYFKSKSDRIFAIKRPKTLSTKTMCCGINSHYHYCHNHRKDLLPKLVAAILKHDYSDPELKSMFKEHEERVKKRFGKHLKEMKGGLYMASLKEFDSTHPHDAYPEIIIPAQNLIKCSWEELEHLGKGIFKGKKSKKIFKLEQSLPKYGDRFDKPDNKSEG